MDYDDWILLAAENQYITKYLKIREEKLQLASSTLKRPSKRRVFLRKSSQEKLQSFKTIKEK